MKAGAAAIAILFCATCHAQKTGAPTLTPRTNAPAEPADESLDARITAPLEIPPDASGLYIYDKGRELLEADFEQAGLTGYLTLANDTLLRKGEALTFFFARTEIGGDRVYFLTHEVHRTRYEFEGKYQQRPPKPKTLYPEFLLDGTLTIHRTDQQGKESRTQQHVVFRRSLAQLTERP